MTVPSEAFVAGPPSPVRPNAPLPAMLITVPEAAGDCACVVRTHRNEPNPTRSAPSSPQDRKGILEGQKVGAAECKPRFQRHEAQARLEGRKLFHGVPGHADVWILVGARDVRDDHSKALALVDQSFYHVRVGKSQNTSRLGSLNRRAGAFVVPALARARGPDHRTGTTIGERFMARKSHYPSDPSRTRW